MALTYFLKIDGIFGDATSKGYEGWFSLDAFSLGENNPAPAYGSGAGAGVANFSDLFVSLSDNTGLTALLTRLTAGQVLGAIEIEGVNDQGQVLYDLTLNDVLISSLQQSGSAGSFEPNTTLSFNYGQIGIVTHTVGGDGNLDPALSFGWDLVTQEEIDPATLQVPADGPGLVIPDPVAYFLKIDGIAGNSNSKGHEGWFELDAFSYGEAVAIAQASGGAAAGQVQFSDLNFVLTDNTPLAALLQRGADGTAIVAFEIEGVGVDGQTVFDLTLNEVRVSSVSQSDSEGGETAMSISVNYARMGLVTTSVNANGTPGPSQEFGWDLQQNEPLDPGSLTPAAAGATVSVPDPVTYFLKIAGVAGDSTTKGYEGWFEISSLSLGESNTSSGNLGGGGAGKVSIQDVFVTLNNNGALASLMLNNAMGYNDGKFLPAVEIDGVSFGGSGEVRKVYDLTLNDVVISSVSQGDSSDGGTAFTGVSFNFGKIGLTTTSYNADGTFNAEQEFGWDLATNAAIDPDSMVAVDSAGTSDVVLDPTVYYLKIDGIAGNSTDKGHEGWFELDSFSLGQSSSDSVQFGAGQMNFQDLSLVLRDNTPLAALLSSSVAGNSIIALEIEGVAGTRTVYDLTLNGVRVSSVQQQGSSDSGDPATVASFNFDKIKLVTTGQNPDGSVGDSLGFAWNVATDTRITDLSSVVDPTAGATTGSVDPVTYFVKISGIRGDATSKGHEGWFELPSFSFGGSNSYNPIFGGGGASKANFQDLNLILADNSALAQLLFSTASGKFLPALEIEGVAAGGQTVYDLTLNNVLVSSVQQGASAGSGPPVSSYSFNYAQIGLVTNGLDSNGAPVAVQSFGWDLTTNQTLNPAVLATPTNAPGELSGDPDVYFLKIEGVVGNSVSKGHEGWFELSSFSLGAANSLSVSAGSGTGAGKANFGDLAVVLTGTNALTTLMENSVKGLTIGALKIEGVALNGQVVYDLTLNSVLVSSVQLSGSEGAGAPAIFASFAYAKIGLVTTVLDPDGSPGDRKEFGWNLEQNSYVDPDTLNTPTNSPPAVSITNQLLDSDTGASSSDFVTSNGQVTLSGTASDDGSVSSVHIFDGATDLGAAVLVGVNWTFSTNLTPGSHALKAVATDNSGNITETAVQPQIVVDAAGPTVQIVSQTLTDDTGAAGDLLTSDGRVTVTGTAADGVTLASVHIFDGLDDLGAATVNGPNWSFATTLAAGSHALRAVATDTAGNSTSTAVQSQIIVDTTGPAVQFDSQVLANDTGVSGTDLISTDGLVTLSGTLSDGNGIAGVHIFDGANDLGAATVVGTTWTFATTLPPGAHMLRAIATDLAGNTSSTDPQPQIFVDATAPVVAIVSQVLTVDTGLSPSDLVTSDGRVTLGGTASDDGTIASLRVFDGATDLGAAVLVGGNWSFSTTLSVGSHALYVVATDAAGRVSSTGTQPQITVVSSDPIVGQPGQTTVNGTADADEIYFGTSNLLISAGAGDDMISIAEGTTSGFHFIDGGAGSDTLDLSRLTTASTVNLAAMTAGGAQLGYTFLSSIENVIGGSANDTMTANNVKNTFTGGAGADRYVYQTLDAARNGATFVSGNGDVITDFYATLDGAGAQHDTIDLRTIDAIQGKKDDPFTFIATPWNGTGNQFTAAGQLRVQYVIDAQGQQHTIISGNVNTVGQGNGLAADFQIDLLGYHAISASDFML